jgi:hypothetical protein
MVCHGYLAGLSAIFGKNAAESLCCKIPFPKCAGWAERDRNISVHGPNRTDNLLKDHS